MAATFNQKRSLRPSVKHFSHCHSWRPFEAKEEDEIICSGCELDLLDSAYKCTKSTSDFFLHKSCFELPRQLQHKFHPQHTLSFVSAPPYDNDRFTSDACGDYGTGFAYHRPACEYDLHVSCAKMPETLKRDDRVRRLLS